MGKREANPALPDSELMFHSDRWLDKYLMGAMLYAEEIPSTGGNTMSPTCMPPTIAERGPEIPYRHVAGGQRFRLRNTGKDGRYDRKPSACRPPVVRTHPETGRKALYVNRLMTESHWPIGRRK